MNEQLSIYTSLDEARDWLSVRLDEGTNCPCCGQRAQSYRRSITGPMVGTLHRVLVQQDDQLAHGNERWVHLADIEQPSRDVSTAQYFEVFTQHPERRGEWMVTDKGRDFLAGKARVWKVAHVFDGRVQGYSGGEVTVFQVAPGFDPEALGL